MPYYVLHVLYPHSFVFPTLHPSLMLHVRSSIIQYTRFAILVSAPHVTTCLESSVQIGPRR